MSPVQRILVNTKNSGSVAIAATSAVLRTTTVTGALKPNQIRSVMTTATLDDNKIRLGIAESANETLCPTALAISHKPQAINGVRHDQRVVPLRTSPADNALSIPILK